MAGFSCHFFRFKINTQRRSGTLFWYLKVRGGLYFGDIVSFMILIFRSSTIMILYHRKIKTSTHFKVPDLHCSLSKWMCKQMSKQLSKQLSRQLSKGLSKRLSKQLSKRLSKRLSKLLPDQNILPRVSLKRLRDQIKKALLNFVLKIIGIVSFKQLQEC